MPLPLKIRDLMPAGFLGVLADELGLGSTTDLVQIIKRERSSSKHWPAVVALAQKTNREGFDKWAAANPDKLPAQAFAPAA
jgi:hypothetical protein